MNKYEVPHFGMQLSSQQQLKVSSNFLAMKYPETSFLIFTSKGGTGKTSLSCTTAVKAGVEGKKVLLVNTDLASNLQNILQCEVYDQVKPVNTVQNLWVMDIDPEISAKEYLT